MSARSTGGRRRTSTAAVRITAPHPNCSHCSHGSIAPRTRKNGRTANWLIASSISTSTCLSCPTLARLKANPETNDAKTPLTPSRPEPPRTSNASSRVNIRIGPFSAVWWRSEKWRALAADTPARTPSTRAPRICQPISRAACPAVRGVATASAITTRGRASPSFAPDSRDSSCRSSSGRSRSAASPVTAAEARTGSVGQIAVPKSSATANGIPNAQIARPVEISAIAGITTTRRSARRRQCRRIAEKG